MSRKELNKRNKLISMVLESWNDDGKLDKFEALQLVSFIKKAADFSTGNDPIMEAGEEFALSYYGGKLADASQKGYDLIDDKGRKIQVKSRTLKGYYKNGARKIKTTVKTSHNDFDLIVLVIFDEDGAYDSHWEITRDYFNDNATHDAHDNIYILPNTQTQWDNYERKNK